MDNIFIIIGSTLAGFFAGLITAYLTTNLKFKEEKKKWARKFSLKYLTAKVSGSRQAQEFAAQ